VFLQADVTFCLIAENLIELTLELVRNPGVASIQIPLPDETERLDLIAAQPAAGNLPSGSDVTPAALAKLTAGLERVQLLSLIADAAENQRPLTLKFLTQRKKQLIEAESGGLLEFVQSRFDLSMVAGQAAAKRKLLDAAQAIRAGRTDVVPMGYVICGPVSTGKTFLTTCFAGEIGIPAVMLKNFRSMWQGVRTCRKSGDTPGWLHGNNRLEHLTGVSPGFFARSHRGEPRAGAEPAQGHEPDRGHRG